MSGLRIDFAGGKSAFTPGEPLSGHVAWRMDDAPSSAELRLFWYTSGKGTQDVGVVSTMTFASPQAQDQRSFTLPLPREPYSCSGQLISVAWAVELILEPGGHVERHEFVLSPTQKEIVLGREGS